MGSQVYHMMHVAKLTCATDKQHQSLSALSVQLDKIPPKLTALDSVHKYLTDRSVSLRGQGIPDASSMCARMTALEEQIARGDRPPSGSPPPTSVPHQSSGSSAGIHSLLKSHTEAITETWKWTSSLLLAMMQQRSTNLQLHQTMLEHAAQLVRLTAGAPSSAGATAPGSDTQPAHHAASATATAAVSACPLVAPVEGFLAAGADMLSPDIASDQPEQTVTDPPAELSDPMAPASSPPPQEPLLVCSDSEDE
eukprot:4005205-Amphidinium_carterae.1